MRKSVNTGIAVSFALLVAAMPVRADLITNGGFEEPALAGGTWDLFEGIPGWYLVDGDWIEVQNNVAGIPYEGEQFVELDSTRPSTIGQVVDTEVGQEYVLSFAFAARPGTSIPYDNEMQVTWGDTVVFSGLAEGATPDWTVYTRHVVATSSQTLLTFGDISPNRQNSFGVYIDAVSLIAKVPEPGSLGLLGLGMVCLGLMRRRRWN